MTKYACRHFLGLFPDGMQQCNMGIDVRKWAVRCNGGSNKGIGLRLPCTKQSGEKPLFDCPHLCRKTQEEIDQQVADMHERMNALVKALPVVNTMREKMIAHRLRSAKATCPWCGEKDALQVSCAIDHNNHIQCRCSACDEGFIE